MEVQLPASCSPSFPGNTRLGALSSAGGTFCTGLVFLARWSVPPAPSEAEGLFVSGAWPLSRGESAD